MENIIHINNKTGQMVPSGYPNTTEYVRRALVSGMTQEEIRAWSKEHYHELLKLPFALRLQAFQAALLDKMSADFTSQKGGAE